MGLLLNMKTQKVSASLIRFHCPISGPIAELAREVLAFLVGKRFHCPISGPIAELSEVEKLPGKALRFHCPISGPIAER